MCYYNKCCSEKENRNRGGIEFRIEWSEKLPWEGGISAKLNGNKEANHFVTNGREFLSEEIKITKAQRREHP